MGAAMTDVVIRADGLSKRYSLGREMSAWRESVNGFLLRPFRRRPAGRPAADEVIWALRDVSFEIGRGEIVGVIGRNGAGKSTLLKVLSQITAPTTGRAEIFGQVRSLLEVGTGFHPELTGRENVYLNGAILGMRRAEIEAKFEEIVDFAGVGRFLDTPVKHFSSGMYVRLAFAVGAHLQPDILIVDEVLAVGDVEFQRKCIGHMERVAAQGRTVVIVTHSMSLVKALCTRALLLERGRLSGSGAVDHVVGQYLGSGRVDPADKLVREEDHEPGGGAEIRVCRVRLLDPVHDGFAVYWRQPISLLVELEVRTPLVDARVGAGLRLDDGTFVFVVYNDDGDQSRWTLTPGRYTVRLTIQNDLRPGIYTLHLGAYQQFAGKNLFAVNAARLEVLEFSTEGRTPGIANPGLVSGVKSVFRCAETVEAERLLA
jgi:lipopolysaccharide transport system ATP-binding protein